MEKTDVIKAVAEAECLFTENHPYLDGMNGVSDGAVCPDCQGTGLRWPSLSQRCPSNAGHSLDCPSYNNEPCTGRIPDVTLEKVLDLLLRTANDLAGAGLVSIGLRLRFLCQNSRVRKATPR